MKQLITSLLLLLSAVGAIAGPTLCPTHYPRGAAPEIQRDASRASTREVCFDAFGVMHSGVSRTPLWSAEHLTPAGLSAARALIREDDFHEEDRLPVAQRAFLRDYARSGFDRGHMAPSADMPTARAQAQSFSLANIAPQNADTNRNLWSEIESAVRKKVKVEGALYVLTGPVFQGTRAQRLNGRVLVPTHLFKLIYDPRRDRAAAYFVANEATQQYQVISVAQLEQIAGIVFFPWMTAEARATPLALPPPLAPRHNYRAAGYVRSPAFIESMARHAARALLR